MTVELKQYTFTYEKGEERRFKQIMDRLDPDEFKIVKDTYLTKPDDGRYSDLETVVEMEPEAAATFRFGMKNVKIKRQRTEEESAAEEAAQKEYDERNKITITVHTGTPTP